MRALPAAVRLVVVLTAALYFAPTLVAQGRRHRRTEAIFAINLFLGWTLLGWVVALVWAFT
jgi:Superinfection immunity protein